MAEPNNEPKLLTVPELAALLRTTPAGIRGRIYRGLIPKAAILRAPSTTDGPPRGKLLFRRSVIEKHFKPDGGSK